MTSGRWITASILFLALAAPAAARSRLVVLDRSTLACSDEQALETAFMRARLHDGPAFSDHAAAPSGTSRARGNTERAHAADRAHRRAATRVGRKLFMAETVTLPVKGPSNTRCTWDRA